MSGPKTGRNGRHPLPNRDDLAAYMGAIGASAESQIVAYDAGNAMFAARLWWLMRWLGHENIAVLDGGLAAWRDTGHPLETNPPPVRQGSFKAKAPLVSTMDYAALRHAAGRLVIDARAPDRFRGENETLDATGGHIPGARNRFFKDNLTLDGRFKTQAALRAAYTEILAGRPVDEVVLSCGSGVTACHNLLAMEIAGLQGAALYPGSWSEWSVQPDTLIEKG
jgi:thiosulfate/3-mercaptopyruvate sulfurtransferase